MVPLSHGASAKVMGAVVLLPAGRVTETVDELGQLVSLPLGTSEYW